MWPSSALAVLWAWDHLREEPRERLDRTLLGFSPSAAVLALVAEAPVANGLRGMRLASTTRASCRAGRRRFGHRRGGMLLRRGHLAATDKKLRPTGQADLYARIGHAGVDRTFQSAGDVVLAKGLNFVHRLPTSIRPQSGALYQLLGIMLE